MHHPALVLKHTRHIAGRERGGGGGGSSGRRGKNGIRGATETTPSIIVPRVGCCNVEGDFADAAAILPQSLKPPDACLVCVRQHFNTEISVFRFSAIKLDQDVIPPCCYWLLEEKPLHHYENCKPPLASHPPLHLPLAHIRHLSHPRFHFGSPLPAVRAASAPLPHPCCFLSHSTTPTLKLHPSPPPFWPLPSSFSPFLLHTS